jgi:hypothetical protein
MAEWWRRLPPEQRRVYERSAAISSLPLAPGSDLSGAVEEIEGALAERNRGATENAAQRLVDRLCARFKVPAVEVRVAGVRPHDQRGELHGLYVPGNGRAPDRISVWMRTSKRHDVVAIKTFLRTLVHEVCHHLDYSLLDLPYSFHSTGFYQRESSLMRAVARGTAAAPRRRGTSAATRDRDATPRGLLPRDARTRARADGGEPARLPGLCPAATPAERPENPSGLERLRAVAAAIAARQHPDERQERENGQDRFERAQAARLADSQSIEPQDDHPGGRDSR